VAAIHVEPCKIFCAMVQNITIWFVEIEIIHNLSGWRKATLIRRERQGKGKNKCICFL
jgi:hypothetical protein